MARKRNLDGQHMIALYSHGWSVRELMEYFKCARSSIEYHLKDYAQRRDIKAEDIPKLLEQTKQRIEFLLTRKSVFHHQESLVELLWGLRRLIRLRRNYELLDK